MKSDLKIKIKIKITSVISNQNHIFARKIRSKSRSLFSSPPFPRFVLKFHFASASERGGGGLVVQIFSAPIFYLLKNFPAPNFFLSLIFSCLKFSTTKFFSDQTFSHKSEIHTFYPLQFHLFPNILQLLQLN